MRAQIRAGSVPPAARQTAGKTGGIRGTLRHNLDTAGSKPCASRVVDTLQRRATVGPQVPTRGNQQVAAPFRLFKRRIHQQVLSACRPCRQQRTVAVNTQGIRPSASGMVLLRRFDIQQLDRFANKCRLHYDR